MVVQRLKVRVAPEYNCNISYYAICFINWNYSSTVSTTPNHSIGGGARGSERAPSRDESARYGSEKLYVGLTNGQGERAAAGKGTHRGTDMNLKHGVGQKVTTKTLAEN